MDLPPKIRADYHQQSLHADDHFEPFRRWAKPSVWMVLGFIIGLICTKTIMSKKPTQITFNEKNETMAFQTSALIIQEQRPTTSTA